MKILLLIFFFLINNDAFTYDALQTATLTNKSTSGRTLRFDVGKMHGLDSEDTCELTNRDGPVGRPTYNFLGSGKLVKVFQNYSYWYFPVVKSDMLEVGKSYQLHVRKKVYEGRKDIPIKYNIASSISPEAIEDRKNGYDQDFPDSLITQRDLVEINALKDDSDSKNQLEIQKNRGFQKVSPVIINGQVNDTLALDTYVKDNSEKINMARKEQLAKDQNKSQVKKINANEYGYDQLYSDIGYRTEQDLSYMSHSEFDKYIKNKEYSEDIPKSVKKMIEKEEQMWSAQMDDKELSAFIKRTGINKEIYRRSRAHLSETSHEFTLYLAAHLSSNTTETDENYRSGGSSSGIMYEYHMQKMSRDFLAWSFDTLIERSVFNYDLGGVNGRLTYNAIGGHLNYYFYNYPTSKKKFALFIGAGLKYGIGELDSVNINNTYKFDVLALPSAHLGVKYRIPANRVYERDLNIGFGFLGKVTTESLNVASTDDISDSISGEDKLSNLRFEFGVSFYF